MAANENQLLIVLIDECESLAMGRQAALAGNEPSDAIRAVNSLLTSIDRLRHLPNVLLLATSNIPTALDDAFTDRVDWRIRVGSPCPRAVYTILQAALNELMAKHILTPFTHIADFNPQKENCSREDVSGVLHQLAQVLHGISGRILKKVPFLAIARIGIKSHSVSMAQFLMSLRAIAQEYSEERLMGDLAKSI